MQKVLGAKNKPQKGQNQEKRKKRCVVGALSKSVNGRAALEAE